MSFVVQSNIRKRGVIFLILIVLLIVGAFSISYINRGMSAGAYSEDKAAVSYLRKIKAQESKMMSIYRAIDEQTRILSTESSLGKEKFIENMNTVKADIEQTLKEIEDIEPPSGMSEFRSMTITMCKGLLNVTNNYIQGVYENNQTSINTAQSTFKKFREDSRQRGLRLINTFDKAKVKYKINFDGTLQYWYKTINDTITFEN